MKYKDIDELMEDYTSLPIKKKSDLSKFETATITASRQKIFNLKRIAIAVSAVIVIFLAVFLPVCLTQTEKSDSDIYLTENEYSIAELAIAAFDPLPSAQFTVNFQNIDADKPHFLSKKRIVANDEKKVIGTYCEFSGENTHVSFICLLKKYKLDILTEYDNFSVSTVIDEYTVWYDVIEKDCLYVYYLRFDDDNYDYYLKMENNELIPIDSLFCLIEKN